MLIIFGLSLGFCTSHLAPLAMALAVCAVVIGYSEVYICNFAAHHGSKEPVDDFMPQLCTLHVTSKQEAHCIQNDDLFPLYACTISSHTMLF